MSLAIVILNYRTAGMTLDCLASLAPQMAQLPGAKAIVIDNGSGDGSAERLRDAAAARQWDWIQLIALPENVGFSAGNNRGIEAAGEAEFILLLNSDTLVHDGCLAYCLSVMREQVSIGILSCMLVGADGKPQIAARRFSTPPRQFVAATGLPWKYPRLFRWADPEWRVDPHAQPADVDWVCGAFMFCRGDLLRRLGGLDEDFFFYGEDYELCHRVHRAGFRVRYDPTASTTHLGGGSSDASRLAVTEKSRLTWRGRYLVSRKCHGRLATGVLRIIDIANYGIRSLVYRARHGRSGDRYRYSTQVLSLLTGRL